VTSTTPIALQEPEACTEVFAMPRRVDLPKLARRGLGWSSALLVGKYTLSIATTAILARLLNARDYGLLAMVATITVLAQAISDCGLSWATVQREKLERNQIDALFLINCAFGIILTTLCCVAAPYAASFYHRPELTRIIYATSGMLFLSAVAVQPNALLLRQMKLKELNFCGMGSLVVSAAVTITMAFRGYGYWALVVQLLLQQFIVAVLSFPVSGYYPRWPKHLSNIAPLLRFGGYSTLYGIVNYFSRNLDNVLVGKYCGAAALGYYSRAYFLMTLPGMVVIGMFSSTLIPALSSLRKDPAGMQAVYLRAVRLIVMLGCSFAFFLAAAAPELVEIVYGTKWNAVVPILLWLSIAGVFQPLQNTSQWLYIVAERGRGMFLMGSFIAVSAAIAFALGIRSGPVGVAHAYAIANTIIAYPVLLMGHRACGLAMEKTIAAAAPLLFSALTMGIVVYLVGAASSAFGLGVGERLLLKGVTGVGVYAACVWRLSPPTCSELARCLRPRFALS
jgi:O-antigen/teichoic acid export membrane protein